MKVGSKIPKASELSICAIAVINLTSSLRRETTPIPTGSPSVIPIGRQPIGVPAMAGAVVIQLDLEKSSPSPSVLTHAGE